LSATIGEVRPTGSVELTALAVSLAEAAGMSSRPLPRSILPEPSAKALGLPEAAMALRILTAEAVGCFSRRRAAAPATIGDENDVPETSDIPPLFD